MFLNVFRAQQRKALRSGVVWVELVLLAAITALLVVLTNTVTELSAQAPTTAAGQIAEMLEHTGTSTLGQLLVVVLAGAMMAHEYSNRSLHLWLSRGVSRSALLWAKFGSIILPLALFFVVTAVVTGPVAGAFVYADQGSVGPLLGEAAGLAKTAALGTVAMLPYAALAVVLAVAGRSMLVAIGGGMAPLVAETLLVQITSIIGGRAVDIVAYLPRGLAQGLLGMEAPAPFSVLDPAPAGLLIAVYTVGLMGLATLLFRRQDLND
jgi:ABC-type transport system involved in multi-copper enzyme maturation permease subunit